MIKICFCSLIPTYKRHPSYTVTHSLFDAGNPFLEKRKLYYLYFHRFILEMPRPRRNDIDRRSRRTQNRSNERQNQSQEEREIQNQNQRERMARSRSGHSPEERIQRNEQDRLKQTHKQNTRTIAGIMRN